MCHGHPLSNVRLSEILRGHHRRSSAARRIQSWAQLMLARKYVDTCRSNATTCIQSYARRRLGILDVYFWRTRIWWTRYCLEDKAATHIQCVYLWKCFHRNTFNAGLLRASSPGLVCYW